MFVSIRLKNFRSFKNTDELLMKAESICEFRDSVINWSRNKTDDVDTTALQIIMGDNNSGKSNILAGMKCIKAILLAGEITNENVDQYTAFCDHFEKPISLGISFIENQKLFEYDLTFVVGDQIQILNELLKVNRAVLFSRKGNKVQVASNRKATIYFDNKRTILFDKLEEVVLPIQANELYVTGSFRYNIAYELMSDMMVFVNDRFLIMDGIKPQNEIQYPKEIQKFLKAIHYDCDVTQLATASGGTKRFIYLCDLVFDALITKKTLVIDELDCGLQADLVMMLLSLFHNRKYNPHGAQLIFTTNNPLYLDNEFIRRDEITFIKKVDNMSTCTSLLVYAKRENNYLRKYMTHEYKVLPRRNIGYFTKKS